MYCTSILLLGGVGNMKNGKTMIMMRLNYHGRKMRVQNEIRFTRSLDKWGEAAKLGN